MASTLDQQAAEDTDLLSLQTDNHPLIHDNLQIVTPPPLLLTGNPIGHTPKSGLNPIADAAANLFTMIGKLKHINTYSDLSKLQIELSQEIDIFHETVKNHGYSAEYTVVCRYVMCATIDEIISHAAFGAEGKWDEYSLLLAFKQDLEHQDKFFTIMERIVKEPALYIDLMELMYLCLSLEYKGRYRHAEHGQFQLDQIINSLYKHIRAYRGTFSKILSPTPLKAPKSILESHLKRKTSIRSIFIVTSCIILTILIGLGYLMDVMSNEPSNHITESGKKA